MGRYPMGNKVIVTRAPRLNLVSKESYYLSCKGYAIEADGTATVVDSNGNAFYIEPRRQHIHLWGDYGLIYPMETLEDVAKWVSGGRKLEDLQGDSKSEWVPFSSLGYNDLFEIPYGGNGLFMKLGHCYEFCGITYRMTKIGSPDNFRFDDSSALVWPVRFDLGDTITITAG
jgi:hypothetical protein